jgi:hypothetical protein
LDVVAEAAALFFAAAHRLEDIAPHRKGFSHDRAAIIEQRSHTSFEMYKLGGRTLRISTIHF